MVAAAAILTVLVVQVVPLHAGAAADGSREASPMREERWRLLEVRPAPVYTCGEHMPTDWAQALLSRILSAEPLSCGNRRFPGRCQCLNRSGHA